MQKKQIFLQFTFSYYYEYIIAYKNLFKKFMTQFYKNDIQSLELCMWVRANFSDVEKKYFLKAQKHIRNLRLIPWLRYIAVWNSIAMKSSHENSDIDLFVVTEKNRLWLVRICMTLYFFIIWLRKTSSKHAGTFCLSFFVNIDALDFSGIAIKDDIYLFYRLLTLKPILDYNDTQQKIRDANTWANFNDFSEYREGAKMYTSITGRKKQGSSIFYNYLDTILKNIFIRKTWQSYEKLWKPFWVIINDNMLKFHDNDKRKYFSQKIAEQKAWKKIKNT